MYQQKYSKVPSFTVRAFTNLEKSGQQKDIVCGTLQGTDISPLKVAGKMIFLFHRWDMLVIRRVV